jgi:diguanylate cyclase (GGDEF)-like protein
MEKAAGQGAITAALGVASSIQGEWFVSVDPKAPDAGRDLRPVLNRVLTPGYLYRVTLIRFVSKTRVEYVLDLPEDGSEDYSPPGKLEDVPSQTPYLVNSTGYAGVHLSQPGAFLAGWAPIYQGDKQAGTVLVVVDGNEVQHAIHTINAAMTIVLLVLVVLSGLVAYRFATTFEKTAVTDGLMNIYNHKYFKQRLEQEVAKSNRYGQQTSLVLLDIDFFKKVNDTYGHATGDLVLKQLARIVTDTCRNTDVVARYGGEEIAIILTHTGIAGAQEFAERLRLKVSQHVVRDPEEDAEFRVTVSIGVAQCEKGVNMMDLIRRTDAALYHSKRTGRNRVTLYQEDILMPPEEAQTKPKLR